MDDVRTIAYMSAVRLLLLLSAILAALTGVIGPRPSAAQPVAASALAETTGAERVAAVAVLASPGSVRPDRLAPQPPLSSATAPAPYAPLYADRLRE